MDNPVDQCRRHDGRSEQENVCAWRRGAGRDRRHNEKVRLSS